MTPDPRIPDDEIIYRRVPPGTTWQKPGPTITSLNFELRPGEVGVSVTRSSMTSPETLLGLAGGSTETGWLVARATVGRLRSLGLDVVHAPLAEDAGHSEIRSATRSLGDRELRRAVAKAFEIMQGEGRGNAEVSRDE